MCVDEYAEFIDRLKVWKQQLDGLMEYKGKDCLSNTDKRSAALLELYWRCININITRLKFGGSPSDLMIWDGLSWDSLEDEFSKVVECAEVVVRLEDGESLVDQPQWHIELGILPAVSSVVGRCRDPVIRRRAIALTQAYRMQEGFMDTNLTVGIWRGLVAVEEKGRTVRSCEDIPAEARVRGFQVEPGPGQNQATVQYQLERGSEVKIIQLG